MRRLLPVLLVVTVAWSLWSAAPVAAHGAETALSVVAADDTATGTVRYRIRVVYQNDGDPVPGLAPTAVAIAPDGAERPAVPMIPADVAGEYEGEVLLDGPGAWRVRFDVAEPTGTLVVDRTVPEPTSAPPTTEPPTTEPTTTSPASTPTTTPADVSADDAADDAAEDESSAGLLIGIAVALAALSGLAVLVRRRFS